MCRPADIWWMHLLPPARLDLIFRSCFSLNLAAGVILCGALAAAEVKEIAAGDEAWLPGGKEADGILGDFVLRNDKVTALVSHNAPLRRANMSTFYGADGVTPGCLYDLALREGTPNDQLIYFGPAGQKGEVSYVRMVPQSKPGEASVEVVVTAARGAGIYRRHEYRVRDGEQGLWVITTLRNETTTPVKAGTKDSWTRFNETGENQGVTWADAIDPADRAGYAYGQAPWEGATTVPDLVDLKPGEEVTWARFVAVGKSPAEAWALVLGTKGLPLGRLTGAFTDPSGAPALQAALTLTVGKGTLKAYPDEKGHLSLPWPVGVVQATVEDRGRESKKLELTVASEQGTAFDGTLGEATRLRFEIRDEAGKSLPCKAQFLAKDATPEVDLGPIMRAHGCKDQYHSERGDFAVQLPAGSYRVVVTRGIEYSHLAQEVVLAQGQEIVIKGTLKRLVDTTGWISTDFHNHSTPSGDNVCGTKDRLINIAAEHLEFTPTTEHNRIYDWRPAIEALGLQNEIQTLVGMELTGRGSHFNCFPLTPVPFTQDWGAPVWNEDPRNTALTLRAWQGERDDRWIQVNHPDLGFLYADRYADGKADGGYVGITEMVNGMETENFVGDGILADSPWRLSRAKGSLATKVDYVRQFIWLQLLNLGHRIHPVAVSDAHTVYGNGVGGWRMFLPSKTDEPAKIDWTGDLAAHALAGHFTLTTGPFLQVTANKEFLPGDDLTANGEVNLQVKVQCTDWIDIDRVQVLVNGRKVPELNFTRQTHPQMFSNGVVKFDQTLPVKLEKDAHLIVVVLGENGDLKTGFGTSSQGKMRPMAYHTPFYVDVDGNGFKANGDTLGYEVPVMKMTPDAVRAKLGVQEGASPPDAVSQPK